MKEKERNVNYELLRIIAMIMIVALHYTGFSGAIEHVKVFSFNYYFIILIRVLTSISVNIYILITGYYMVNSKIKTKNILNIWFKTWTYSVLGFFLICILENKISIKNMIRALLPYSAEEYWFVTAYLTLYIFIPYLNFFIKKLDKINHKKLIVTGFVIFCLIAVVFENTSIRINRGLSVLWFIYLYLIASYIRLYVNFEEIDIKKLFYIFLCSLFFSVMILSFCNMLFNKYVDRICNNNSPTILIISICFFVFFYYVKINNIFFKKQIIKLSKLTFAVYLIHQNKYLSPIIWKIFDSSKYVNTKFLVLHFGISVFVIFCVSILIELLRNKIFVIFSKIFNNNKIKKKMINIDEILNIKTLE